jgi:ketosteroid isomerase-like protein
MRVLVLTLACLLGLGGTLSAQQAPAPEPLPTVALPPELDRVLRDYERAWEARDAAALAALFAPDGFVLRPGHPPVRGRAAIEEAYRGAGGPLGLRALAFAHADSVGYIIGAFAPGAGQADVGKFILTLSRAPDGRWLISADMDNPSSRPRPMGSPQPQQ